MAAQTCAVTQHATLSTTVADTITFTSPGNSLCVTNHDTVQLLYFRFDGTTAVGAADDTYVVRPGQAKVIPYGCASLSIVGSGNAYSAEQI